VPGGDEVSHNQLPSPDVSQYYSEKQVSEPSLYMTKDYLLTLQLLHDALNLDLAGRDKIHSWFEEDKTHKQSPIREWCLAAVTTTAKCGAKHVLSKKEVLLNMVLLSNNRVFGAFSLSKSRRLIANRITGYKETERILRS